MVYTDHQDFFPSGNSTMGRSTQSMGLSGTFTSFQIHVLFASFTLQSNSWLLNFSILFLTSIYSLFHSLAKLYVAFTFHIEFAWFRRSPGLVSNSVSVFQLHLTRSFSLAVFFSLSASVRQTVCLFVCLSLFFCLSICFSVPPLVCLST